jgi:hypothetical protein
MTSQLEMIDPSKPALTFEQRVKFAEIEIQMIQSRFDKFDTQFAGNRKLAVTMTAAAIAAASKLNPTIVLFSASGASLVLLGLEVFNRKVFFSRLVERHLLLRGWLNETERLHEMLIYDPFNDSGLQVPLEWRLERSGLFRFEMYVFYLLLAAAPILVRYYALC